VNCPIIPAIDIHTHWGRLLLGEDYESVYDTSEVVSRLKEYGLKAVVNLDGECGEYFDRMIKKTEGFENYIITFGNVDLTRFAERSFDEYVYSSIKRQVSLGMRGLKFWKTLGLSLKDDEGRYLRVDDKRLSIIWQTAAEFNLPVLIHIADPTAFFKPVDFNNERREELQIHPDWSFCGDDFYKFEELMEMQETLIATNPKTTFVVAHCGSYSENLIAVGKMLDRYPNMYVDIAERINELGRQPYSSYDFLNRFKERVLFGTDMIPTDINRYPINYRFLETRDEYFDYSTHLVPPQGNWKIYGLGLEKNVLDYIYLKNALKILHM